jgi:apolipoprotein N-acyltransferase
LEFLRTWLFSGFPWELLGYSQYHHLWLIQMADLWGVYGISTLIVFVNAVLALAILLWLEKPWRAHRLSGRTMAYTLAAMAGVLALTLGYGIYRVGTTDKAAANATQAKVAVIQGNIDQAVKWDPKFQIKTIDTYRNLSLKAAAKGIDLVIWPETAAPFYFLHDANLSRMVIDAVQAAGTSFIIGSPSFTTNPTAYEYHNSAYMVTPEGKSAGKYDKVHLVPFGEYVPLRRWLPFIKKMVAQVGDFKAGRSGNTLAWQDHRVGILICYEVIFPSLARKMVQNGAHLLVNITNDAWFGRTSAPYQHYAMAVLRAVENRRWLARAANTGISGFIDPCGRIVEATPLYEQAAATAQVALLEQKSYYSRWSDWPLALLTFGLPMVIIALLIRQNPRKR